MQALYVSISDWCPLGQGKPPGVINCIVLYLHSKHAGHTECRAGKMQQTLAEKGLGRTEATCFNLFLKSYPSDS
jgi:hypothetical protein